MTIGERIKTIRKEKGLSQQALAKKTGLAKITISDYEAGKYVPRKENIIKIASALGVTPSQIDSRFVVADSLQYFSTEDLLEEIKRRCYQMNNK